MWTVGRELVRSEFDKEASHLVLTLKARMHLSIYGPSDCMREIMSAKAYYAIVICGLT